jgi:hypothetical protein
MAGKPFQVVQDEDETPPTETVAQPSFLESAGFQTLMMGLGALSQRTVVALSRLFALLVIASDFWLWASIPAPNTYQLIALGMYAAFSLAAIFIARSK